MSNLSRALSVFRALSVLLLGTALASPALAATNPHITVRPQARLTAKIDGSKVAPVPNSHKASVSRLPDLGRVAGTMPMTHMLLVLQGTAEQEYALRGLLDEQQDKTSSNYHQWMTPDTFGAAFGVDHSDVTKVTGWLQDAGFTVNSVAKSARVIDFSGTAAQVEAAFHTEIHNYTVNGETRHANATDISLPKALSPVVMGVASLSNFPLHRDLAYKGVVVRGADGQLHPAASVVAAGAGPRPTPETTFGTTHYIGGGDLQYLYNSAPLLAAGNDGTGVHIGILGQTRILLGDVQEYRSVFNLKPNNPTFNLIGPDPGTTGDDGESDLDVESSGAVAPGAQIDFYYAGYGTGDGGIDSSALYVVENNLDDVVSLSYGEAEADLGSDNAFYNFVWEQAASQGISVFVSSGDSGPDTIDDGAATGAKYSVSGLASTPFNVSVGGTMMNEGAAAGTYWSATNTLPGNISALGYIPELPWNESTFDPFGNVAFGGIVAESSGISIEYGIPSWQVGPGIGATDPVPTKGTVSGFVVPGPHRLQPDVSLEAAAYDDGFLVCSEGSCVSDASGNLEQASVYGGTSIAAPSFAGVQALVDQANGGRQGLPNYYYYRLAAKQNATTCNTVALALTTNAGCSFHDIETGNNFIPSKAGGTLANGNYIGWSAGAGFDMAIGLGSPDIYQLATNWKSITFNATKTTLTLSPTTIPSVGTTMNYTIGVAPSTGTGTPTGDVSLIAQVAAPYNAIGFATLSGGAASGTIVGATLSALPAGTYNVVAHYAGDTVFGGSNSAPVQVVIGKATSILQLTSNYFNPTNFALSPTTTFTYGQNVYFNTEVCDSTAIANGACASGYPTGTVSYALSKGGVALPVATDILDTFDNAYYDAGTGSAVEQLVPTAPVLPAGVYSVVASYAGDASYTAVQNAPFTITINPAVSALTLAASTPEIASGATATLNITMASATQASPFITPNGLLPPSGTVTLTDSVAGALGTATLTAKGAAVFQTKLLTTLGTHTITAVYNGDSNYAASATPYKTAAITVGGVAGPIPTLTFTVGGVASTSSTVGQTVALVAAVAAPATGTVYFYDAGVALGSATLSATTHTASLNAAGLVAGTHSFTATYGGSTTLLLDSSTSAAYPFIVAKNPDTLLLQTGTQSATGKSVAMNVTFLPAYQTYSTRTGLESAVTPGVASPINYLDGTTILGSAPIAQLPGSGYYVSGYTTTALTPGVHVLSAILAPDPNYLSTPSNTQTFNIGLTTTTLTDGGITNIGTNMPLKLTATVVPQVANTAPIVGSVTFKEGATVLGVATTNVNGVFTATVGIPTVGTHTLTAVFSGDANYYTSTGILSASIVTETPGFTIAVNPASLTIKQGSSGTATVTDTVYGNYNGFANLSCSGLPINTYCTFGSPSLLMAGDNGSSSIPVTITTLLKSNVQEGPKSGGLLWLPALLLAGLLVMRRKQFTTRGRQLMTLAILLCGTLASTGCGKGSGNLPNTATGVGSPLGAYTVVISASGNGVTSASPNITPTATIALTIN